MHWISYLSFSNSFVHRVHGQDFKNIWPSAHNNFQTKHAHKTCAKLGKNKFNNELKQSK